MAIQFTKALSQTKLLQAFNNNIIRFHSDVTGTPTKATLTGFGFVSVLYPNPNGIFYFNFKDYITAEINQNNFAGDFSAPGPTFQKGVDAGLFMSDNLEIKIHFQETVLTDDVITIPLNFILGVEQITDRFTEQFQNNNSMNILSPLSNNGIAYLKFWRGYPFDFSTFLGFNFAPGTQFVLLVAGTNVTVQNTNRINAIYLSDGINYLIPSTQQYLDFGNVVVEQIDGACGIYVKFRNKYGRWNYWLFENGHYNTRSSKSLGELNNNYNDIEDTISPVVQIGRVGDSNIKVIGQRLREKDKLILEEIIDSPKIYYFIGQPNTIPTQKDWLEVSLKTTSFVTQTPKKKTYNYNIEFDLPNRYTQTL
jgi:hypothetical protein